jgi:hypothetical protein
MNSSAVGGWTPGHVIDATRGSDIPPHVADTIRSLHPDLKRSIKSAVRAIAIGPESGELLVRELDGLWKFAPKVLSIVPLEKTAQKALTQWAG